MKFALPLIIALAASAAAPAMAQDAVVPEIKSVHFDVAVGAWARPTYAGSDEYESGPWLSFRNLQINGASDGDARMGFSVTPNFDVVGDRDGDDDDRLEGLNDISRAYEAGLRLSYRVGETTAYGTVRKGFGGHHGVTGEAGVKYRMNPTDKLTLWASVEAGWGNGRFNETYFGITDSEAARTDFDAYDIGGGVNSAAAKLEGRYKITENTSILGEVKYTRIIGDAADSPIVLDKSQPSVRLGIVRTLNFGF